jgi:hypothetical protein
MCGVSEQHGQDMEHSQRTLVCKRTGSTPFKGSHRRVVSRGEVPTMSINCGISCTALSYHSVTVGCHALIYLTCFSNLFCNSVRYVFNCTAMHSVVNFRIAMELYRNGYFLFRLSIETKQKTYVLRSGSSNFNNF